MGRCISGRVQIRTTGPIPLSLSLSLDLLSLSAFSDWACTLSDFVDFFSLSLSSFFLHSVLGCFFSSGGGVFSSFQRGRAWRRSFQISTVLPHLQRKDNEISYMYLTVLFAVFVKQDFYLRGIISGNHPVRACTTVKSPNSQAL